MSSPTPMVCARFVLLTLSAVKVSEEGLRVMYYWWQRGEQFWLFTVYDKDERNDLSYDQRKLLKQLLEREVRARELT